MTMPADQVKLLREFTQLCKVNSDILHLPELAFYRDWLGSMGATIPPLKETSKAEPPPKAEPTPEPKMEEEEEPEEEDVESDIELDESGVVKDEDDELPEYADENTEVTEEMIDIANDRRNDAMDAANEGRAEAFPDLRIPLPPIRKSYTIAEKISTVMWFRSNGRNLSLTERKFGISRKSLRTWDKEYDRLLEHSANNKMMRRKIGSGAEPRSHKLDSEVFKWFLAMKNAGTLINNCMLMNQARHVARSLNIDNFQGSYGWLRRWKMRFNVDGSEYVKDRRRKSCPSSTAIVTGNGVDAGIFMNAATKGENHMFPGIRFENCETVETDPLHCYRGHCVTSFPSVKKSEKYFESDCTLNNSHINNSAENKFNKSLLLEDHNPITNPIFQGEGHIPDSASGLSQDLIHEIYNRKVPRYVIIKSEPELFSSELTESQDEILKNRLRHDFKQCSEFTVKRFETKGESPLV